MKFFERSFEHTDHPEQQAFEIAFTEELISSEQLRFYLMTAFFVAVSVVFFVLFIILPEIYFKVFGDTDIWIWMTLFGTGGVIYAFLVRWRVVGLIKQGNNNWKWIRYFNTLEEMIISTLAIYMLSLAIGPIQALVSPAAEIYYLFILLSCLRLDSKICFFAGATAMISYLFICWYLLGTSTIDPALLGFIAEPLGYFYRSLFILSAGCAAAFVTYRYRGVIERAIVNQQKTVEVERDRIMRDLHDDVASNLLTLTHQAESTRSRQLANDTLKNLREIIYSLDTNSQKQLVDLLSSWRDEIEERLFSAHIEFRWHQQEEVATVSMSARQLLNLGRALREIASNAIKHAEPQNMYVQWYLRDGTLVLCVTDDGHHLPIEQWEEGKGLCNIKRRASELEGDVQWRLTNDKSKELCQVELLVPIAQE